MLFYTSIVFYIIPCVVLMPSVKRRTKKKPLNSFFLYWYNCIILLVNVLFKVSIQSNLVVQHLVNALIYIQQ